jgi:hypothetical protein
MCWFAHMSKQLGFWNQSIRKATTKTRTRTRLVCQRWRSARPRQRRSQEIRPRWVSNFVPKPRHFPLRSCSTTCWNTNWWMQSY